MDTKTFTLTKRIAKHGKQNIICLPQMLKDELPSGSIVQIRIEVLKEAEQ